MKCFVIEITEITDKRMMGKDDAAPLSEKSYIRISASIALLTAKARKYLRRQKNLQAEMKVYWNLLISQQGMQIECNALWYDHAWSTIRALIKPNMCFLLLVSICLITTTVINRSVIVVVKVLLLLLRTIAFIWLFTRVKYTIGLLNALLVPHIYITLDTTQKWCDWLIQVWYAIRWSWTCIRDARSSINHHSFSKRRPNRAERLLYDP